MANIYNVGLSDNTDILRGEYERGFEGRYGQSPLLGPEDNTVFGWLAGVGGLERGRGIIQQYFKMDGNDGYFNKFAHSTYVLRQNVNLINAALGNKKNADPKGRQISIVSSCDGCFKYFNLIVPMTYDWDTRTTCPACIS